MLSIILVGIMTLAVIVLLVLNIVGITHHDATSAVIWALLSIINIFYVVRLAKDENKKKKTLAYYVVMSVISIIFLVYDLIRLT